MFKGYSFWIRVQGRRESKLGFRVSRCTSTQVAKSSVLMLGAAKEAEFDCCSSEALPYDFPYVPLY